MNTEQKGKNGGVVSTILASFTTILIIVIFIVLVIWLTTSPLKAAATPTDYAELYQTEIEPLLAKDETARQVITNNPEKLCIYMHISDVLTGTDFCGELTEKELAEKLEYDPYLRQQYVERYLSYLDKKYN